MGTGEGGTCVTVVTEPARCLLVSLGTLQAPLSTSSAGYGKNAETVSLKRADEETPSRRGGL